MSFPQLPSEISPNGQEVWDWAAKMSAHTQRLDKARRLRADIAKIGRQCGDCYFWMKSRDCPREKNVNGYSRGPSCNDNPCPKLVVEINKVDRRRSLSQELAAIETVLA